MEPVLATRISLLHSAQHREHGTQIGNLKTQFVSELISTERSCLLKMSQAAREVSSSQVALKSVSRARNLDHSNASFFVAHEFGQVLWSHQEEKMAIEYVDDLLSRNTDISATTRALALSQQVSLFL